MLQARCQPLSVDIRFVEKTPCCNSAKLAAFPRAAICDKKAKNRTGSDANGDGLIRMLMDGLVGQLCTFDRLLANAATDFLAAFQCGSQAFAGFANFFASHIGSSSHKCVRIFR